MTMMKTSSRWSGIGFQALAVLLALGFTTLVMLISGADPLQVYQNIISGAVGSPVKIADILVAWTPLLLATAGLLLTFTAGLWNIGIEGQITLGAIFTTWALRVLQPTDLPPALIMGIGFLAGALGGMIWAGLVALLKIFGNVNEIFGGLGLNFVATALTIWLIFGPWKRPGVGSMSGTEPFPLNCGCRLCRAFASVLCRWHWASSQLRWCMCYYAAPILVCALRLLDATAEQPI